MQLREYLRLVTPPLALNLYRGLRNGGTPRGAPAALPKIRATELFPGIERLSLCVCWTHIVPEAWSLPLCELLTLAGICRYLSPRSIFEIGTFKGSTAFVMAMNTPDDAKIRTLDLEPVPLEIAGRPFTVGELYRGSPFEFKISQLYADSALFDFEPFSRSSDLVFIDGNHNYEHVQTDSQNAFRILRPGGVILWDDYHPEWHHDVVRYLNKLGTQKPLFQIEGTRLVVYRS